MTREDRIEWIVNKNDENYVEERLYEKTKKTKVKKKRSKYAYVV